MPRLCTQIACFIHPKPQIFHLQSYCRREASKTHIWEVGTSESFALLPEKFWKDQWIDYQNRREIMTVSKKQRFCIFQQSLCEIFQVPHTEIKLVIFTEALIVSCSTERGEGSVCQQHLSSKTSEVYGWQHYKNRSGAYQLLLKQSPARYYLYLLFLRIKCVQLETETQN